LIADWDRLKRESETKPASSPTGKATNDVGAEVLSLRDQLARQSANATALFRVCICLGMFLKL
jgi:hypothetical protein